MGESQALAAILYQLPGSQQKVRAGLREYHPVFLAASSANTPSHRDNEEKNPLATGSVA